MLRTLSRTSILLGLALIVVILGASAVEARGPKHPKNGKVPLLAPVASCIDFNSGTVCNPDDADADGWRGELETRVGSDPHDAASTPEYGLLDEQTGSNTCHDGIDDDRDGRTDAGDPGCHVTCRDFARGLACTDRDHDGWLQYVEAAYGSNPKDHSSTPETPALPGTCSDGIDNDRDGLTDDADPSCNSADIGNCIDFTGKPVCTDRSIPFLLFRTDISFCIDFSSQDNCDADSYPGAVELLAGSDPNDAHSTPEFALLDEQTHWARTCSDGVDNDLDGRSDQRDPGCRVTCRDFKAGADCKDRDHDGWLQYVESWLGSDPNNGASTPENVLNPGSCRDGVDNDLDGRADSGPADSADDGCDVISDCIDFNNPVSSCTDRP